MVDELGTDVARLLRHSDGRPADTSHLLFDAAGNHSRKQTVVTLSNLADSDAVDDRIGEKVQHREKVDDVELEVDDPVRRVLRINDGRQEAEDHVRQPE